MNDWKNEKNKTDYVNLKVHVKINLTLILIGIIISISLMLISIRFHILVFALKPQSLTYYIAKFHHLWVWNGTWINQNVINSLKWMMYITFATIIQSAVFVLSIFWLAYLRCGWYSNVVHMRMKNVPISIFR